MKKIIKSVGFFILGALSITIWYGCETMTVNEPTTCLIYGDTRELTDTVYLYDNGRHVDIILDEGNGRFAGFGWGSETFYLKVPTWDDLTYRAVYNATKKNNKTLMHVKENLIKSEDWVAIPVTEEQVDELWDNIFRSFDLDSVGKLKFVQNGYGEHDKFYKAKGSYSLNYTCNSWANDMLKKSGIYARKHAIFSEEVIDIHRK
tara:strand:+ start:2729 stop:3340 length:612 start_codon:yes stop_codon:yes gene_type:complete